MDIGLSIYQALGLFLLSAGLIWYFSNKLSDVVNFIDSRFGLGDAFGGTILLSIVTNLPEIAITLNGAIKGNIDLAAGNILGGVLIQTVLLVAFDFSSRKKDTRPLSSLFNANTSRLQVLVLAVLLGLVLIGSQLGEHLVWWRVSPIEMLILFIWLGSLMRVGRMEKKNTYSTPPSSSPAPPLKVYKTGWAIVMLVVIAMVIFIFGLLLEVTSSMIAEHYHIEGLIFGASILALVTALPEWSGGLEFVKQRTYKPIVSDIFGGNAFLLLLFIPITFISGRSALSFLSGVYIYFAWFALGMVLVYLYSMHRDRRSSSKRYAGIGWDAWVVLVLYLCCLWGMIYF